MRWLGASGDGSNNNNSSEVDIAALVDFLRPKHFSLSVMTPFGKSARKRCCPNLSIRFSDVVPMAVTRLAVEATS